MSNIYNQEKPLEDMTFSEMLKIPLKSDDTEDWLDVHVTRSIGLAIVWGWMKLKAHHETVVLLAILLGITAGVLFSYIDLWSNILGVVVMLLSFFCYQAYGLMAGLAGRKSLLGRILEGCYTFVCFFVVYVAIAIRIYYVPMPGTDTAWGMAGWTLVAIAGLLGHSPQASLAKYYKQIHRWMKDGKAASEPERYERQRDIYENMPEGKPRLERLFGKIYHYVYAHHCHRLEKRTPKFQRLRDAIIKIHGGVEHLPEDMKGDFLNGSRQLMNCANLLSCSYRIIYLAIACLIDQPWGYPLVEIVVLSCLYIHMHKTHEDLCAAIFNKYMKATT